jgi:hypothetical protein
MAPLLDEEVDELNQFLLSGSASDETMSMSELDGYLTAIVVDPKTVAQTATTGEKQFQAGWMRTLRALTPTRELLLPVFACVL